MIPPTASCAASPDTNPHRDTDSHFNPDMHRDTDTDSHFNPDTPCTSQPDTEHNMCCKESAPSRYRDPARAIDTRACKSAEISPRYRHP